jgi:2-dehydropantoate 2-reductase
MNLRYAVVGTGALGGFYGGMLARSGKTVDFLFHSDFEFVKEHGLKVDSKFGDFHLSEVNAYNRPQDMPKCDVILVGLKTLNNNILKDILPHITHSSSVVLLIQNGLGVEEDVSAMFPDLAIAGGLAFICANKVGPGHVEHLDYGKLNIGAYCNSDTSVIQQICEDLKTAGVPAEFSADLLRSRWQKLVWNVPFNGMTVVLNTTTDKLISSPAIRSLSYDIMYEVINGARSCGIDIEDSYADKIVAMTEKMTPYATSMKLDYDCRRPMEIEYIYSRPIETARKAGYEMKSVMMLERQLKFIQTTY